MSDAVSEARDAQIPVYALDIEWEISPRIEGKALEHLVVSLLLINILYVNEVTKYISYVLNFFPNFFQLICFLKKSPISNYRKFSISLHHFSR